MKKAFTLIELLVAISIIATLTAILLPNFMGARQRARDASKKADLDSLKNGLRLYYNDNQTYPIETEVSDLSGYLADYVPNSSEIGFTYSAINNGDGFQLCVGLEEAKVEDIESSQLKCVVDNEVCGVGLTTDDTLFVVCAN